MSKFQDKYRIESARLREWDYSNPWWYYVTINTKEHEEYFGKIENGNMILNELGGKAEICWEEIPNHFPQVELDYFVIMPNHLHGIIIINTNVETRHASSLQNKKLTLSNIVGSFKSAVTKSAHEKGSINFSWQPRFYDRIIRNEKELFNIRKYIEQNPLKWELEKDNPENIFDL
jgi:REP element-mobilizing transposase RayT